jgi:acetyl-CoA C-acetyltransferase
MAGVSRPASEIEFAEVFDGTPFDELLAYEALGLASQGKGAEFALEGGSAAGGSCPVNLSGGAQSTNLRFAAGMMRILEAYLQLSHRAGPVQLVAPRQGLAHGATSYPAQGHAVFVLRNY